MAEHKDHYSHYGNHECEYFPCHKVPEGFDFNCLFCYCPLYALGDRCGGNFRYIQGGIKDCSGCLFPHKRENYDKINARDGEIMQLAKKRDEGE